MSWPMVALGEVAEFLDKMRKPITAKDREPGPFPYYGANGQQDSINDYIFDEPLVLLAEDGGHFDEPHKGVAYRVSGKCWVNNHAHVLRARTNADINYIGCVLRNMPLQRYITGTTRGKLTQAGARRIEIPLPPLPEQRRIAAILDAADALRCRRRAAIETLYTLQAALFAEMFSEEGHTTRKMLGKLGRVVTGATPPSKLAGMFGGTIPFVTPGDLETERSADRHVTALGATTSRMVKEGSTLVCCIGATIGKIGQANSMVAFNQQINAVEWGPMIVPSYGTFAVRQIRHLIVGRATSTTLPILKKSLFEKLEIPVPKLNRQQEFDCKLRQMKSQRTAMTTHRAHLETLFAALQSRAFAGEL